MDWQLLVDRTAQAVETGTGMALPDVGRSLTDKVLLEAARWTTDRDSVIVNRARSAALADYGYEKLAVYYKWRPVIFASSAAVSAISLAMAWRRRRVPEALILYGLSGIFSGAVAYTTRPNLLRPAPAPLPPVAQTPAPVPPEAIAAGAPPPADPSAVAQFMGWLDSRISKLNRTRPGWEAQTWHRVAHDLGYGTLNPHVAMLLTRNTQ